MCNKFDKLNDKVERILQSYNVENAHLIANEIMGELEAYSENVYEEGTVEGSKESQSSMYLH